MRPTSALRSNAAVNCLKTSFSSLVSELWRFVFWRVVIPGEGSSPNSSQSSDNLYGEKSLQGSYPGATEKSMVFISSGGGVHELAVEPSGYNNMLLCILWNIWAFLALMLTLRCWGIIVLLRNCWRGGSIVESLHVQQKATNALPDRGGNEWSLFFSFFNHSGRNNRWRNIGWWAWQLLAQA